MAQKLDQRADLFSLGSVLYQMAAGRPPFRANGTVAVLKRVAEDTPRAIREIIPETPQWLCDIIAKLHAKNPDDRYQSAREVADVLADCEAQLKANAKLKDFSHSPVESRGSRVWWKWVAAVALLAVIGVALTWWRGWVKEFFTDRSPVAESGAQGETPHTPSVPPLAVAPYDAAQARQHQEAWAKHLGVPVEYTNSLGMKFRLIPPGEFLMGSADNEAGASLNEKPQHQVRLTRPMLMGLHEVTVGQFRNFIEATSYKTEAETSGLGANYWDVTQFRMIQNSDITWARPPFKQADDYPVCCVTWNDAQKFCEWLSRKDGRAYVLPTEAQWEFACRAGSSTPVPFGDTFEVTKANFGNSLWPDQYCGFLPTKCLRSFRHDRQRLRVVPGRSPYLRPRIGNRSDGIASRHAQACFPRRLLFERRARPSPLRKATCGLAAACLRRPGVSCGYSGRRRQASTGSRHAAAVTDDAQEQHRHGVRDRAEGQIVAGRLQGQAGREGREDPGRLLLGQVRDHAGGVGESDGGKPQLLLTHRRRQGRREGHP